MRREVVIGPYILCVILFTLIMFTYCKKQEPIDIPEPEPTKVVSVSKTVEVQEIKLVQEETTQIETQQDSTIEYTTNNDISTNEGDTTWYITAYCPCSICCGQYAATNIRYDENGNEYHVGASGGRLIAGYSVASSLPFGTKVVIEGLGEVCVSDRGVSGNHLDLYFDTHEQALQFATGRYSGHIIGG